MIDELEIECPVCNSRTRFTNVEYFDASKKDLENAEAHPETVVSPDMSHEFYNAIHYAFKDALPRMIAPAIAKIESHNVGVSKERCTMSDRSFKVYLYLFFNHEKQTAGVSFRTHEEIHDRN